MCTVIVHVPASVGEPLRLLAVRDEDPARPWDAIGPWWPETYPGVVGVRDVRAGGAWLAADPDEGRLAVLLNRADVETIPDDAVRSRGGLVLESVAGRSPGEHPPTHGFNLVEVAGTRVSVTTWDGTDRRAVQLGPGTHMIAHDDVDDAATPRIARWLAPFTEAHTAPATDASAPAVADLDEPAGTPPGDWFAPWLALLEASADLPPTDDEAIIRDNRPHGYPTLSLLVCTATIGPDGVELAYGAFDEPGRWNRPDLA
ncbi:NRDE family protein [Microbacterium sp. BK668]|uniref:NRDE family protein n=1 Tax=Microbacterium sp. BK668 TaxID=2512118 RepID=UPI0010619565|nr:NRDE family protein [Microbacterium sp. BK668]TDN92093.1 transport and Golgi organization protein 2 [Microbacterium sp. BK668]